MVRSLAAMREVVRVVCYLLASKSLLSPGLKAILDNLIPALRPFREFQLDPVLFILGSNSKRVELWGVTNQNVPNEQERNETVCPLLDLTHFA